MKPPPFDHAAPSTVDEATALLARDGATVIAGGQSLLQDLRWRRLAPTLLVDVAGIDELAGVAEGAGGGAVSIGARVRHRDAEHGIADGPLRSLLARTAEWIAHPPVRSRGTVVGSLAYAHHASEWCALASGLGGAVELASVRGRRTLPVADLLVAPGVTAREPDELITALRLPLLEPGTRVGIAESRRTHASFAHVVAVVAVTPAGVAMIGLGGAGPTALRAHAAEDAWRATGESRAAGEAAAAHDAAAAPEHPHADAEYTRHVAGVLVRRALEGAA